MSEVAPGIFKFKFFSDFFCEKFLEEMDHFEQSLIQNKVQVRRPNSMNNYGVILGNLLSHNIL